METYEPTEELQRNLHENETVKWVIRPHSLAYALSRINLPRLIGIFGLLIALAFVLGPFIFFISLFALARFTDLETLIEVGSGLLAPALVLLVGIVLLYLLLPPVLNLFFRRVEYAATDYRLIKYGGMFGRNMRSVPFEGIQDAEYQVSLLEQLFNIGTVTIDTSWGYRTPTFRFVPEYTEFAHEVTDIASENRSLFDSSRGVDGSAGDPATYSTGSGIDAGEPSNELRESLYRGEEIQWVVSPNRKSQLVSRLYTTFLKTTIISMFLSLGAIGTMLFLSNAGIISATFSLGLVSEPVITIFGVAYLVSLVEILVWYVYATIEYAATDFRLIKHKKYIGHTLKAVRIAGLHDAGYSIGILNRLFDVGEVYIDSSRGYRKLIFEHVPNPPDFAREITELAGSGIVSEQMPPPPERTVELRASEPSVSLQSNLHDNESILWAIRPRPIPDRFITEYAVTDDRVIKYSGVLNRTFVSVPLDGIHDAEYSIHPLGRVFNFGNVILDTDWNHESMVLKGVPTPIVVASEITRIARVGHSAAIGGDANQTDSPEEEGDAENSD